MILDALVSLYTRFVLFPFFIPSPLFMALSAERLGYWILLRQSVLTYPYLRTKYTKCVSLHVFK